MWLQSAEYAEKVMRQIIILYRNARNLLKSNIDVGGTTKWRRWFTGVYLESWVMTGMKNDTTTSHDQCMNPVLNKLLWDFKIQTENKIEHNKSDIEVLDKIERKYLIIDVACPFENRVKGKEKEEIENYQELKRVFKSIWKLRRVTVSHNWCIRNRLERHKKVVTRDRCHMSFRIIAESVLTGYCQNPLQSLSRTPTVTGGDLMFKEDSSKPYRCFV